MTKPAPDPLSRQARKAGGVYYTPRYIVDFIVRETVGKLLPGKSPGLRILDPACGDGAFLRGAARYLLDRRPASAPQRDTLCGVDIDPQAVSAARQSLRTEAATLSVDIQCGNALIAPDYFDGSTATIAAARRRLKAFDWSAAFPSVMAAGGFDAVIGNPPWGGDIDGALDYFHKTYPRSTREHTDSCKLFIELALRLARPGGYVGFVVPQTVLRQSRLRDIRELLLETAIECLVDLGANVFTNVVAPSCMVICRKQPAGPNQRTAYLDLAALSPEDQRSALNDTPLPATLVRQVEFGTNTDFAFRPAVHPARAEVIPLGSLPGWRILDAGINYQRVNVGMMQKGNSDLASRLLYQGPRERPTDHMYWKGCDIDRYWIAAATGRWCRTDVALRPNEVVRLRQEVYDTAPKILLRQTADRPLATLDSSGVWFGRSVLAILIDPNSDYSPLYLLGLLNSRYLAHVYRQLTGEQGRVFAQVKIVNLRQLPIRTIDFSKAAERARHDSLVELAGKMLHSARREEMIDDEIDRLVYDLYGVRRPRSQKLAAKRSPGQFRQRSK